MWSLLKRDLQEFVTTVAGDTKEILANVLQKVDPDAEGEEAQQEEAEERATMTTDPTILALQTDAATYAEVGKGHLLTPLRGHDEDDEEELSWGDDDTPEAHAPEQEAHARDIDTIDAAASVIGAASRPASSDGACGAETGDVTEHGVQQPVAIEKPSPAQPRELDATKTEGAEIEEPGARAASPMKHDTAPPASAASVSKASHRTEEQVSAMRAEQHRRAMQQRQAIGAAEETEGLRKQVTTLQQQLKAAQQHAEALERDLKKQTAAVISLTTENHGLKAKLIALEESIAEGAKPVGNKMPASAQEGTSHASQHGEEASPRVAERTSSTAAALPPECTPMSAESWQSKEPSSGGSTGVVVVGHEDGEDEDAWESWT